MSFINLVKSRYSVRSFQNREVEKDMILQVLEAGRLAPSAVNFQPLHYIVITKSDEKQKIWDAYPRGWLKDAPVIIVVCGNHNESWKRKDGKDHCDIDAAIAVDHMTLAAADLGLGTCWVCAFDAKHCHESLGLPEHMEVITLMPLGYPKGERITEAKRKSMEELVSWERYEA